jgi:hypothetical protein
MTDRIGELVVKKCDASEFHGCDIIFSGLDSDVAGDIGARHSIYLLRSSNSGQKWLS